MRTTPRPTMLYVAVACLVAVPVLLGTLIPARQAGAGALTFHATQQVEMSADDPSLSTPGLNATFGYANITNFNFSITYQSASNATPSYVNLTVVHENWTVSYPLARVNNASSNYLAGVRFGVILVLPTIGNYSHYFTASNSMGTTRYPAVGSIAGPSIVWLRNYTISVLPFKWLDSSAAITPEDRPYPYSPYLIYNYDLQFPFSMYDSTFNQIQVSYYGFLRFTRFPIDYTNRYPINVSSSDPHAQYAIVGWSDIIWNYVSTGQSDLKVLSTAEYFLVEQQIMLNVSTPILYNASLQYVIYRNGTILLSYDHVRINFPVNESVGVNLGDGIHYSPYDFSINLTQVTLKFDYAYVNDPRVSYSCTPAFGNQVTTFNFTLRYQDMENRAPTSIILTFYGTNYTMSPTSTTDTVYVDGRTYSRTFQFLAPGIPYNHSFHVFTPDGWWHSPVIHAPTVTYSNANAPTVENVIIDPPQGWVNYTNFTITFTYKDLDNDPPDTLSVVFNASGMIHVVTPFKVVKSDNVTFDGCEYRVDLRLTNASFLYDPNLRFHITVNDSLYATRYPADTQQWLDGPALGSRLNYASCKLYNFDAQAITSPTSVYSLLHTVDLPFNFTFYGLNFTRLIVSRFGFIRFSSSTDLNQPTLGNTTLPSRLAITVGDNNVWYTASPVMYQLFTDKAVFNFTGLSYNSNRFDLQLILYNTGDIVFSFFRLDGFMTGGVNFGDGLHYTAYNLTGTGFPLVETSFIFSPPRVNAPTVIGAVSGNVIGVPFKTADLVNLQGTYRSPGNTAVARVTIKVEGKSYKNVTFQVVTYVMSFSKAGFTDYRANTSFVLSRPFVSGRYNATIAFVDVYGSTFYPAPLSFDVNDPPSTSLEHIGQYGGAGKSLVFSLDYLDAEGISPEFIRVQWDGVNYTMTPSTSDFSTVVTFTRSFLLEHGIHTYAVFVKDKFRPEQKNVTGNKAIDVRWIPVIEVVAFPADMLLITGEVEVKVRITSAEPGATFGIKKLVIAGRLEVPLEPVDGETGTYSAIVPFDWGTYEVYIVVKDNYDNTVTFPASGDKKTITVINLPVILVLAAGIGTAIAVFFFVQVRRKKERAMQHARLKQQVLARKPTRRDIAASAEEKRKERQKEIEEMGAVEVVQPEPVPVKKSAAAKRASSGSSGQSSPATEPTRVHRPAPPSGTQPKDKSGYGQRATDTGTVVNRTVLKEYVERKRKEGARELHYIQIKNDLNIISQKKSAKLYRILQDLVDDEILIRKGSNYVIVG